MRTRGGGERGAMLVHTAVALVGLLGFSAMTVDYGVLWVARAQAQNAADAAALAATMSLAYGKTDDTARVRNVAKATAAQHTIWGAAAAVQDGDVEIGKCPAKTPGSALLCVSVTVHRDQARGNALPTFFGQLLGVANQGVLAVATGQVALGADATCIKPWAIPDKWVEKNAGGTGGGKKDDDDDDDDDEGGTGGTGGTWTSLSTFDRYNASKTNPKQWTLLSPADYYVGAAGTSSGSGYQAPLDVGVRFRLETGAWDNASITGSSHLRVELDNPACSGGGNSLMKCNISSCNPNAVQIGSTIPVQTGDGGITTKNALDEFLAGDTATWVCADGGSATGRNCLGYPSKAATKRLVAVPAFNVQKYMDNLYSGATTSGSGSVTVTRIVGFFIESYDKDGINGRLSYIPATGAVTNTIPDPASFLRKVVLVR